MAVANGWPTTVQSCQGTSSAGVPVVAEVNAIGVTESKTAPLGPDPDGIMTVLETPGLYRVHINGRRLLERILGIERRESGKLIDLEGRRPRGDRAGEGPSQT